MNKVILVGRLGKDPETRFTQNQQEVCNFSVATSEKWTDKSGEKQEKTEWHKIVVWGKLASICAQYLRKGSLALIEGKLQTREYEAEAGGKRYVTEVVASNVQFLDSRGARDESAQDEAAGMFG